MISFRESREYTDKNQFDTQFTKSPAGCLLPASACIFSRILYCSMAGAQSKGVSPNQRDMHAQQGIILIVHEILQLNKVQKTKLF